MRKELTATEVKSVNAPGFYRAGNTLYLKVMPAGSKSWVQRLTIHGGRHDIGLGGYPQVSLAERGNWPFKIARLRGPVATRLQRSRRPNYQHSNRRPRRLSRQTVRAGVVR